MLNERGYYMCISNCNCCNEVELHEVRVDSMEVAPQERTATEGSQDLF